MPQLLCTQFFVSLLVCLGSAFFSAQAHSATLFQVSAEFSIRSVTHGVGDLSDQNAEALASFNLSVGATLNATYILDASVPGFVIDDFGTPIIGYDAVVSGFVSSSNTLFSFDSQLPSGVSIMNSQPGGADIISLVGRGGSIFQGRDFSFRSIIQLFDDNGNAISDSDLDVTVLDDLGRWDDSLNTGLLFTLFFDDGQFVNVSSSFESVSVAAVPIPAAFYLFSSTLLSLFCLKRRSDVTDASRTALPF